MAILLAFATFVISVYYIRSVPYVWFCFIPANVGASGALLFWLKAPAKKKARWRAALASTLVVPCIFLTAAMGVLFSPVPIWQVYLALTALATIIAVWSIVRVKSKANHPWANYYSQVTIEPATPTFNPRRSSRDKA